MTKGTPLSIQEALKDTKFFANRTPETRTEDFQRAFTILSEYRDGAIFLANYAGNSDWERHANGDEVVYVLEGETTLFLIEDDSEKGNPLKTGELLVVPAKTWHRFETPKGAKVMTITPQPTDHSKDWPE
ncbi:MAG: cupin [Gammaproteobacteria bacterium]|nr:cupin [Gammaproteobacteria bacterium]|tara:strand:+ start:38769 stop:39158 length:390 start_codon:yes stop_codon:yes gene_type:complete